MKTFVLAFFKRLGDLILKLIAVKTVAATVVTVVFLTDTKTFGLVGFLAVLIVWLAVVGLRYAEKVAGLLPKTPGSS